MSQDHWFEAVADHLGGAYLRYSFTKGTDNEVAFIWTELGLEPGMRVLDVGCGPGRHALALADRGVEVVGVDISQRFIDIAASANHRLATFVRGDARSLDVGTDFDAVISLCQGGFGLTGGPGADSESERELDEPILAGIAAALKPGGRVAISAFSAYFAVRWAEDHDSFDPVDGVNHESTEVRSPEGITAPAELWTTTYTPRELRLLARVVGLAPQAVYGVSPGAYRRSAPTLDSHEFLLIAAKGVEATPGC